jgi:hypothetical protein
MAETPSDIGARAELVVAERLIRAGHQVFLPLFAPHPRVDLVVLRSGVLERVQCKTASRRGGALFFRSCSNTGNQPAAYRDDVDLFGVWSPHLDEVFLVPVADAPDRGCHLRITPPRNAQHQGIRWAHTYRLEVPPGPPGGAPNS